MDFIPTPAQIAREEAEVPAMITAAMTVDAFQVLLYEGRPFEEDTDAYRRQRAVDYFRAEVTLRRLIEKTPVAPQSTISCAYPTLPPP